MFSTHTLFSDFKTLAWPARLSEAYAGCVACVIGALYSFESQTICEPRASKGLYLTQRVC